jgi:hypothetical protein
MIFLPMEVNYNSEIFTGWSQRELKALKDATAKLRKQQPPPPSNKRIRTGVVGCHYHRGQACFIINAVIDGKKIYAGRLDVFNKEKALAMQEAAIERHKQKNK